MTTQNQVSDENTESSMAPASLREGSDIDRPASNPTGILFAFHADDRSALADAFNAITASGYKVVTESEVWKHHEFLIASFTVESSKREPIAKIIAVGANLWPDDPFDDGWHLEEAGEDAGQPSAMPIVARLNRAKIPDFLFPAIVPESFRIKLCNIIDVHLAPARLPVALLARLGLREISAETKVAEAVLIQNEWSPGLLADLIEAGWTTTELALQSVDPTLNADLRSALTAVLCRDTERLESVLSLTAEAHLVRTRLAGGFTLLHIASSVPKNSAVVEVLLKSSSDVNARANSGSTAFYLAIWADPTVARLLLRNGAEPNTVSFEGDTPLSVAAWQGYADLVSECLKKGASPFITDRSRGHALIWAAQKGRLEIVDEILTFFSQDIDVPTGAQGLGSEDPNFSESATDIPDFVRYRRRRVARSDLRRTALMVAALSGESGVAERLLKGGADPNLHDEKGMSPLHYATNENPAAPETIKTLLRWHADVNNVDNDRETALMYAVRLDQPAILQALLSADPDAEVKNEEGFTALHIAASWGYTESIKALCSHGANPSHFDRKGFAPLHHAVFFRDAGLEAISALIEGGSSPNLLTEDGRTPLSLLVDSPKRDLSDKVGIAKILFDRGGNPWLANNDGRIAILDAVLRGDDAIGQLAFSLRESKQPNSVRLGVVLACAAALGEVDLVASLLKSGASLDERCYEELHPLAIAALRGHLSVVEFLLSLGAHVNSGTKYPSALRCATHGGHIRVVSRLLEAGASPDAPTKDTTPLHTGVWREHLAIVERLIEADAFPDPRTATGLTPLHLAALRGRVDMAQRLSNAGADIEALDGDGDRPLHLAIAKQHTEFVIWLLGRGVLADPGNENGVRPVHFAAEAGLTDILGRLGDAGANLEAIDNSGNTPLHYAAMTGRAQAVRWLLEKKVSPEIKNQEGQRAIDLTGDEMVLAAFEQNGIIQTVVTQAAQESELAHFLTWEEIPSVSLRRIQRLLYRELKSEQINKALEATSATNIRWARLPFYESAMILAVPMGNRRPPNELFVVVSEKDGFAVTLDWTNEPIFRCNEALKWGVSDETAIQYLKFFLFFVRGRLGRFQIVERASELNWLGAANEDVVLSVANYVHPVSMKKSAPTGMVCFSFACAFKNALFETDAYLVLSELFYKWPDEKEPREFSAGQFELRNSRLLLEDLPIIVPRPAGDFG